MSSPLCVLGCLRFVNASDESLLDSTLTTMTSTLLLIALLCQSGLSVNKQRMTVRDEQQSFHHSSSILSMGCECKIVILGAGSDKVRKTKWRPLTFASRGE